MNIPNTLGITPTNLRRVLTAHGRSTTPGLLELPFGNDKFSLAQPLSRQRQFSEREEVSAALTPGKTESSISELSRKCVKVPAKAGDTEMVSASVQNVISEHLIAPAVATPVSQAKQEKQPATTIQEQDVRPPSPNFKRHFRVHGKDAWEYAMRNLGSVDTLMNHYGYVEPSQRPRADVMSKAADSGAVPKKN